MRKKDLNECEDLTNKFCNCFFKSSVIFSLFILCNFSVFLSSCSSEKQDSLKFKLADIESAQGESFLGENKFLYLPIKRCTDKTLGAAEDLVFFSVKSAHVLLLTRSLFEGLFVKDPESNTKDLIPKMQFFDNLEHGTLKEVTPVFCGDLPKEERCFSALSPSNKITPYCESWIQLRGAKWLAWKTPLKK